MYLETEGKRYELMWDDSQYVLSRLREVKDEFGAPVSDANKEKLEHTSDWQQVKWGPNSLIINQTEIKDLRSMWWERNSNNTYVDI